MSYNKSCNCCRNSTWKNIYSLHDFMYRKKDKNYEVFQCTTCYLITTDAKKDLTSIQEYYPKSDYYSYNQENSFVWKLKKIAYQICFSKRIRYTKLLISLILFPLTQMMRGIRIKEDGKLLDIGCGSGKFLSISKSLGMKTYGIEINPKAIEKAKKITNNVYLYQFDTEYKNLTELQEKKFDVIVSNHVVEHVANPKQFFINLEKILKKDGIAIISTPNSQSIWSKAFGKYWSQLDIPRHLYIFNTKNIEMYTELTNLKISKKRHLSTEFGITMSLIYFFENKGITFSDTTRRQLILISRFLFFPLYLTINLLRMGDTIEYHIEHQKME